MATLRTMKSSTLPGFRSFVHVHRLNSQCMKGTITSKRCLASGGNNGGYYILAPDMPSDTEENNPLLKTPVNGGTPNYSLMSSKSCFKAFIKRALLFESCIDDIEMEDNLADKDFDSVVGEIERNLIPLNYTYAVVDHLNTVSNKKFTFPNMNDVRNSFLRSRGRKSHSRVLYESMKTFDSNRKSFNKFQGRVVDKLLLEGKLNGIHLSPNEMDILMFSIKKLTEEGNKFNKNVSKSNELFANFMSDPALFDSIPEGLFGSQKVRDLDPSTVQKPILENSSNRDVRRRFWIEYNSRAFKKSQFNNNSVVIEEIRAARREQAKVIGFDNFAQLSMSSKMAESVESVRSFLNTIHSRSRDSVQMSVETLTEFAKQESRGRVEKLELWDIDFYRKEYIKKEMNVEDKSVEEYFPFPNVLTGMFNTVLRLFQVHVEEVAKGSFESWNEDVRLFNIVSPAGVCGSFYLDPYQRKGDKLMGSESSARVDFLLPRSSFLSTLPLTCLTLNHCKPILTGQHLHLNFSDVRSLFQLFGSILQFTLTEIPYNEINGFNFIESDANRITPQFLDLWLLHDYKTIADCSCHVKTKDPLPRELHDKLRRANYKFSSLGMSGEVYKSALDLALYSNTEFWGDIVNEVWKIYLDPFDRHPDEASLCSFTEIMTGSSPAAYYTLLWSQMLAAEVFGSFEKVMGDEKKVEELGLRFRDTFLAMGGGVASSDSFSNFFGSSKNHLPIVPDHLLRLNTQD